jgi:hypothetical protein
MAGYDVDGDFTKSANESDAPFGGTRGLMVKFFMGTVKDEKASQEAGYPKHKSVEMIRIIVPGDRDNIVEREIFPIDQRRFATSYEKWKAGDPEKLDGLPLAAWPSIDASMVEDLKYFKIYTVEQLASVSDGNMQRIGPLHELRRKAQSFLAAAKDNSILTKFEADVKQKQSEIDSLKQMVAQQNAKIEELAARQNNRR